MNSDEGDKIRKKQSYGYRANESSDDASHVYTSIVESPSRRLEKSTCRLLWNSRRMELMVFRSSWVGGEKKWVRKHLPSNVFKRNSV